MMELNAKSNFLWDWENLVMLNTRSIEAPPKRLHLVDSEIEGIEGFEVGSFYSSGGRSDGATASDLGYASSSKSSKSGSVDSSRNREINGTKFTLETNDCFQQDVRSKKELVSFGPMRRSSTIESSVASGESLIALELGKRTYFEDVSAAGNARNSAPTSLPSDSAVKRSKSSSIGSEIPRCQVEGCHLDLSSAKDYHRKHRVCEDHSKSPKVVINGLERRFCQQCSRFHGLLEFDQKKRSCRRRLSDHNARRRKPKPEVIQFNSMRLPSSLYEDRNELSIAFNQVPVLQTTHGTWNNTSNSKVTQAKLGVFTTVESGGTIELHATHNGLPSPGTKLSPASTQFFPSKGSPSEVFQQGLPVSVAPSNMDATQDLRALSLLSTSSWGSCDPPPAPLDHSTIHATQTALAHPLPANVQSMALDGPPMSLDYWQAQQPLTSGPGSHTSTFQFFKAPNEPSFYLY